MNRKLTLILAALALAAQIRADELEKGFLQPPDSAKPHTWWHWMNGNITKEGITADLEAMQRVGIGGAQIFSVGCGILPGPVDLLTPEWREMMKHAAKEANRVGVELCIQNGPGWSNSGGPWNTPQNAMQQISISETQVKGPAHFTGSLPQPPTKLGCYRDIEVVAFPTPDGEEATMQSLSPKVTASKSGIKGELLWDGKLNTTVALPLPSTEAPVFIQFEFAQPFTARSVVIVLGHGMRNPEGVVQVSADGRKFRDVQTFAFPRNPSDGTMTVSLGNDPAPARFYRVKFTNGGLRAKRMNVAEISFSSCLRTDDLYAKSGMNRGSLNRASIPEESSVAPGLAVKRKEIVTLTGQMNPAGKLNWDVPAGRWTILRIGYTPTGAENHPALKKGQGLECDKLSAEALDGHWAGFVQTIVDDFGPLAGKGKTFNNVLIDSYEVGGQNWTPKFREEFQQRRGYDPLPWLITITGRVVDNPDVTDRFLWDMRRTIADLFAEKYYGHFKELCGQRGLTASFEPYDGPYESLQSGGPADIPMGEFWMTGKGDNMNASVKLASSIGHIYGKPVIGAESFTAAPSETSGRWLNDPYSFKALGDWAFCGGINRFIFHRYALQPWTNRWPGMTMGQWGTHFDRTCTWWEQGRAWMKYLARSQFMLQQGRFVADAAAFCGESAPVQMPAITPALPSGYDYDGINAEVLLNQALMKDGRLMLKSGMSYRVLSLSQPDCVMTPKLLRQLRGFVADGLTLIGAPPQKSPSLDDYPKCDAEVKSLVAEMWGNCDGKTVTEHKLGKGKVVWGQTMAQLLGTLNVKPDFESATNGGSQLRFIHRLDGDSEIYFVSNQREQFEAVDCTFRVSGKAPELWHPDTGRIEPAPVWREDGGRITVPLKFDPAGSVFVVFRQPARADHAVAAKFMPAEKQDASACEFAVAPDGQTEARVWQPGMIEITTAAGKTVKMEARAVPKPVEISGAWELNFPPNWGAPASVSLPKLVSWAEYADKGVKYFSGTATYVKEVEIPEAILGADRLLRLDLGQVKNIAEILVNGKPLGILWKPPFCVDITDAVKPGKNKLEIKVTNLWPNRLIGDEQLPSDRDWAAAGPLKRWPQWLLDGKPSPTGRYTFTTWHLWKKDDKLLPSGLLGPVRLHAVERNTMK